MNWFKANRKWLAPILIVTGIYFVYEAGQGVEEGVSKTVPVVGGVASIGALIWLFLP